jgi:hypothetical protein
MPVAELPVALAPGGADGIDDHGIGHGLISFDGPAEPVRTGRIGFVGGTLTILPL